MAEVGRRSGAAGPYADEELVGEALRPVRDQVVIATKFGWRIEDGRSVGFDSRPEQIKRVADAPLRRLRSDVIDLFYQHRGRPRGCPSKRSPERPAIGR